MRKRISIDNVSDKTVIGKFHDNQLCVVIFENDKDIIPHLHIIDSKTQGENIHVKLLLRKSNYSIDTPNILKDVYIDTLTTILYHSNILMIYPSMVVILQVFPPQGWVIISVILSHPLEMI